MKYSYILAFIVPVITLTLLEFLLVYQHLFYWIVATIFALIVMVHLTFGLSSKTQRDWWNFLILPLVFTASLLVYVSILDNKGFNYYLIQSLFLVCSSFLYFYFKNVYYILMRPSLASGHFLENISSFGNFLAIFFATASIYAMRSFLGISIWSLMLIVPVLIAMVIYQVTWANKISLKNGFLYIILGAVVISQLAIALSFLPLNFNTLGLILAICYYVLIGFMRFFLRGNLNRSGMKFYLVVGTLSIVLILFSSVWT